MSNKRILCVGLCNLDIIQICSTYPEEDSDQRCIDSRWQRGGNASNNCTVLKILEAPCELLASFANSNKSHFLLDDLKARNINIEHCVWHNDCEIPISTVWSSLASGTRTIVHSNPNLPEISFDNFKSCDLSQYGWIHFEGRRNTEEISQMLHSIVLWNESSKTSPKIIVSVELEKPRLSNLQLVTGADYIFLGKDFAKFLGYDNAQQAVHGFKATNMGNYTVICPWGSDDIVALDRNGDQHVCKTFPPRTIKDSLGAGDTFVAGCIFCLLQGKPLAEAIEYASRLAGAKLAEFGFDHLRNFRVRD